MWEIFIGSVILSIVHAVIPNHWIPLIAISRAESWTTKESVTGTFITGFAHTLSTVLIGILVGFAGYKLSGSFEIITSVIAPLILITIGLFYLILDFIHTRRHNHHEHVHIELDKIKNKKSRLAILGTLSLAMFLSPCLELEAYYFHAGTFGWLGIAIVSIVYIIITVSLMTLLVFLGVKGISRFELHFLEHHEKRVTGIILLLLGIMAYFVEF
jgi:nickel/cobalt transporter (NicO) family protein